MRVVAIIQARYQSTRLPGKVLTKVGDETVLARVARRVQQAELVDQVGVATTVKPADEAIVSECEHIGVPVFRGSEDDVLDRYYQAAQAFEADAVVRITADCPLIDPQVCDQVIRAFTDVMPEYASNVVVGRRTFPRGLDTEVMSLAGLARVWREASDDVNRTHVTLYIRKHPEHFHIVSVEGEEDHSEHRWTVDMPDDMDFVQGVYRAFDYSNSFGWRDVLALLERSPALATLNHNVRQKSLDEV